ncbi:MAG: hypothetical protein AB7S38_17430 [Vulcanimicrobiota bacterium]
MPATLQAVRWCLERPCAYRTHSNSPEATSRELFDLGLLGDGEVFENICLVDGCDIPDDTGVWRDFPYIGFPLHGALLEHGASLCHGCDANLAGQRPAGCHGAFYLHPDETEDWLLESVAKLGLEAPFRAAFPETKPVYYGLWLQSPLTDDQRGLLSQLFETLDGEEFAHFRLALRSSLPLQVELAPYGHSDLGYLTTFGHCPRCKATPDMAVPFDREQTCQVCGEVYLPRAQQRCEQWHFPVFVADVLGDEFEAFARRVLAARGHSPKAIQAMVENRQKPPALWPRPKTG